MHVKAGYFFTSPKRVTSPTWGPPPPCKQALSKSRTQYNTDHHEVIIRPFMQNHGSTMRLISPISSENLMQSRLGELGLQSIDVGGAGD